MSRVDSEAHDDLRPEYHASVLGQGVRGNHMNGYKSVTNLALLSPEIRAAFPTDEAVNQALRSLLPARGA